MAWRKAIHLASSLLALAPLVLPGRWGAGLIFLGFLISLGLDALRFKGLLKPMEFLYKPSEARRPSGATALLLAYSLLALVLSPGSAAAVIVWFSLADPLLWLLGPRLRWLRLGKKSALGSALLAALGAGMVWPWWGMSFKILGFVAGGLVDLLASEDNLSVPLAAGLVLLWVEKGGV